MKSKSLVLALIATLSISIITSIDMVGMNTIIKNAYAQSNNWYVGKGAQPNTYYTYKIQEHDTNSGQPFTMTVYFKQYDSTGQYWIAPAYVATPDGKVLNGTLHLSDLDLSNLGSSNVPGSMQSYVGAYHNSIQWLSAFAPKPGLSLSSPYWGKIASIGGSPISPGGSAKVTVPAGSFDTTIVSWHKGVDNNIWVNPNMPFPVKAQTFADVTTGNPPIQYAFDLIATGQGLPPVPKSQVVIPKPPITIQTARGTYYIELLWDPQTIQVGKGTNFGMLFEDASQAIVNDVAYSFKVTDSTGKVITDVHDQAASNGTGTQTVKFTQAGPAIVLVSVDGVAGQPSGEFVESAIFNVVAVGGGAIHIAS